jgi:hypothetical protein
MGIEPTTYSLGSCRSTTELRPRSHQHSPAAARRKGIGVDWISAASGGADGGEFAVQYFAQVDKLA